MTIAVIGMGLIGGSMARTIKLHTAHTVLGCDIREETLHQAEVMGAMDAVFTEDRLEECQMVFVALYPGQIIQWVESHADRFAPGTVVIDCGGVKQVICDRLFPLSAGQAWHFIGGHPMAGRERSGFQYARDDLFDHASMILTPRPEEDPQRLVHLKNFFLDLGFRRVQFTDPRTHDEMIAYTSQMAHIVSSAYVKSPQAQRHRGFSAGSFADMTRVARLNEGMWTELFFANRDALLPEIDSMMQRLQEFRNALAEKDEHEMYRLLREGREIKEALEEN
ncbi:MAG: prephenate dehydrogenase/arogenate dehydrogenase family protein [Clostridia bacterium]|nr:prephenate dehydrogenase/arogenate dehydrogenase family protein [Clostridia bacterium]